MTDVTLITGDGIGPEIAEATRRCIDATGAKINWHLAQAGTDIMKTAGTPIPTNDIWIAAVAFQHGYRLFSKDKHFSLIPGMVQLQE